MYTTKLANRKCFLKTTRAEITFQFLHEVNQLDYGVGYL